MFPPKSTLLVCLSLACSPTSTPTSKATSTPLDTADAADGADSGAPTPPWGDGERTVSGSAYFFDMETFGQIDWIQDVEGARLYVFEAPELEIILDPDDDFAFSIDGIPDGVEVTLALTHPDFVPQLTATHRVDGEDLDRLSFQAVSTRISELASDLLQIDTSDPTMCQMATTVTAPDPQDIYAPGEPGATVTLDPPVPEHLGPFYFSEMVLPAKDLEQTTTDGGVTVVGAEPGEYLWSGHKDGVVFTDVKMKCVGGWLTNASPPWGMNTVNETGR